MKIRLNNFYLESIKPALCIFLCLGCGTWLGNPPDKEGEGPKKLQTQEVGLSFKSSGERQFDLKLKDGSVIGKVSITENRHVIRNVFLYSNTRSDQANYKGPYLIDLLSAEVLPKPEPSSLEVGSYSQAQFQAYQVQAGEIEGLAKDDSIIGYSSIIRGEFQLNGSDIKTPFEYLVEASDTLVIKGKNQDSAPPSVVAGKTQNLVISLDYSNWFVLDSLADVSDRKKMASNIIEALENSSFFEIQSE